MSAAARMPTVRRHQRGQSTTEFVVLALVLAPMFMLVPMLGKYGDLAQQTTQASRYVAFEQTVRGPVTARPDATVLDETRRRLLGASQAPVKTADVAGDYWRDRNPLWTTFRGDPLLAEFRRDVQGAADVAGRDALPGVARFTAQPGFRLPNQNLYTARVMSAPARLTGIDGWLAADHQTQRRTAILIDPWAASGPAEVADRVQRSAASAITPPWNQPYPIEALRLLNETIGRVPPLLLENGYRLGGAPPAPALVLDHAPDVVPCDRLQPRPADCR